MKNISFLITILLLVGYWYYTTHPQQFQNTVAQTQQTTNSAPAVLGQQTKREGCVAVGGLQDIECTPGAANPALTKDVLCSETFSTKSVRNVSTATKNQAYAEYGVKTHKTGEYEVDHLISLELGGSNDLANLWPEAAEPRPGFHEKDVVENYLHDQVCNGSISLPEAQAEEATNWLAIYNTIPHK